MKLSQTIRKTQKIGTQYPGIVTDLTADGHASVTLSRNGATYKSLPVVGGPLKVGQNVYVDFTTPTPTIVAPGVPQKVIPVKQPIIRKGNVPSYNDPDPLVAGTIYWNPFPETVPLPVGMLNMFSAYGVTADVDSVPNPATFQDVLLDFSTKNTAMGLSSNTYLTWGSTDSHAIYGSYYHDFSSNTSYSWAASPQPSFECMDNQGRFYGVTHPSANNWSLCRRNWAAGTNETLYTFSLASNNYYPQGTVFVDHYVVMTINASTGDDNTMRWVIYDTDAESYVTGSQDMTLGTGYETFWNIRAINVGNKVAVVCIKYDDIDWFTTGIVIDPVANTCTTPIAAQYGDGAYDFYDTGSNSTNAYWLMQYDSDVYVGRMNIDGTFTPKLLANNDVDGGWGSINYGTNQQAFVLCGDEVFLHVTTAQTPTKACFFLKLSDMSYTTSYIAKTVGFNIKAYATRICSLNGECWVSVYRAFGGTYTNLYRFNLIDDTVTEQTGITGYHNIYSPEIIGNRLYLYTEIFNSGLGYYQNYISIYPEIV